MTDDLYEQLHALVSRISVHQPGCAHCARRWQEIKELVDEIADRAVDDYRGVRLALAKHLKREVAE